MRLLTLITWLVYSTSVFATEAVDFTFFDNSGRKYTSTTFSDDLEKYYGRSFKEIKLLLIQTPSLEDEMFLEQEKLLKKSGHEELSIIYVVASAKQKYKDGYYTSVKAASNLVAGKPAFRIWLLDTDGAIRHETYAPLSVEQLKKWFIDASVPSDVTYFIGRRNGCDHFRGEPMYSEERKKFLLKKMKELCVGSDKVLSDLKDKYKDNKEVQKLLSVYDDNIE